MAVIMEHINTRRIIPCTVVIAFGLLTACGQSGTAPQDAEDQKLGTAVPAAIRTSNLPDNSLLSAFLEVNGDRRSMTITDSTAEATFTNLPPGASTVVITFEYQSPEFGTVALASAAQTVTLGPGENTLAFNEQDYQYPDNDQDSYANLAEIQNNTNPGDRADPPKQWEQTAVSIAQSGGSASLAVDPNGDGLVVWAESDGAMSNIWFNRFEVTSGWGQAGLVETNDTGDAFLPQVALDANANGLAVWQQSDGATLTHIWANRFDISSGWGTPTRFETNVATPATAPQLSMSANGSAIVVWTQQAGPAEIPLSIWAARFDAATGWDTPQVIEISGQDASSPRIALDAGGNALAVWRQRSVNGDGTLSTEGDLWANLYVADTGWGSFAVSIESIGGDSTSFFDVAMDNDGNGMTVWAQIEETSYSVRANRFDVATGLWEGVKLISPVSENASNFTPPNVEFDAMGNALAIWREQDANAEFNILANGFDPVLGWGEAAPIDNADGNAFINDTRALQFSHGGEAWAVWLQSDGTRSNVWSSRFDPAAGWGTPILVENNNSGSAVVAQIGIDDFGRALVVWSDFLPDFSLRLLSNRLE